MDKTFGVFIVNTFGNDVVTFYYRKLVEDNGGFIINFISDIENNFILPLRFFTSDKNQSTNFSSNLNNVANKKYRNYIIVILSRNNMSEKQIQLIYKNVIDDDGSIFRKFID